MPALPNGSHNMGAKRRGLPKLSSRCQSQELRWECAAMPGVFKPYRRRFYCTAQSTTVRRTTARADNRLLVTSHDELRTLVLSDRRIRHLNFGRRKDTVLTLLRPVLSYST